MHVSDLLDRLSEQEPVPVGNSRSSRVWIKMFWARILAGLLLVCAALWIGAPAVSRYIQGPQDKASGPVGAPLEPQAAPPQVLPQTEPQGAPRPAEPAPEVRPSETIKDPQSSTPGGSSATTEAAPPEKTAGPSAKPALAGPVDREDGKFTVQVSSHPNEKDAAREVERLQSAGVAARVVRAEIPDRGTWYRVQVGRFSDRAQAEQYARQLRERDAVRDFSVTPIE